MQMQDQTHRCDAGNECYDCYTAREAKRQAEDAAETDALLASAPQPKCSHYTQDQGCPLHGETCR